MSKKKYEKGQVKVLNNAIDESHIINKLYDQGKSLLGPLESRKVRGDIKKAEGLKKILSHSPYYQHITTTPLLRVSAALILKDWEIILLRPSHSLALWVLNLIFF